MYVCTYLVIFLIDVIKYSDISNLREKGFIPIQLTGQGTQSILLGDPERWKELPGGGHRAPNVETQRALGAIQDPSLSWEWSCLQLRQVSRQPACELRASLVGFRKIREMGGRGES